MSIDRRSVLKAGVATTAATALAQLPGRTFAQSAPGETIRFLYTNDTHARLAPFVESNVSIGGIARRKTLIDRVRALGGNIVLVDAGDIFQGTLFFNLYEGFADQPFYNALQYDVMTLGNHEFNLGPAHLARFINGLQYPVVSANIDLREDSPLRGAIRQWLTLQRGATRLSIIGLTTQDTTELSSPGQTVRFRPHYDSLQLVADQVQGLGVPVRVGLTHVGAEEDRRLAQLTRGIGVLIGGHSHTRIDPTPEIIQNAAGNPVLVVQAQAWGRFLGVLDVQFSAQGIPVAYRGALIPITSAIPDDPGFVAALRPFQDGVNALGNRQVGTVGVLLFRNRQTETNLGNLITDLMLEATAAAGSQIAFMNAGGIRVDLEPGPVTWGRVLEVMPFGNTMVVFDLPGQALWDALENGVSQWQAEAGRFPQVAGMRFTFDPSRPVGQRILSADIGTARTGFRPLDRSTTYRIVTNDFMFNGGDGYSMFTRFAQNVRLSGELLIDPLYAHFARTPVVTAQLEGRITVVGPLAPAGQRLRFDAPVAIDWDKVTDIDELWAPGEGLTPVSRPVWSF